MQHHTTLVYWSQYPVGVWYYYFGVTQPVMAATTCTLFDTVLTIGVD